MGTFLVFAAQNRWIGIVLSVLTAAYFLYLHPKIELNIYQIYRTGISLYLIALFGLFLSNCNLPQGVVDYMVTLFIALCLLEITSVLYITAVSSAAVFEKNADIRFLAIRLFLILAGALLITALMTFVYVCSAL